MNVVVSQFEGVDTTPGLPLAAGCLVASARADPRLAGVRFSIEVDRGPIDSAAARYEGPDVLGFSLYPWNAVYSLEVARAARRVRPDSLIVAGGPSVPRRPDSARRFLAEHGELDVAVFSEGELAFRELLAAHLRGADLADVGGIAYRRDGGVVLTAPPERIRDLGETASPYLDGTFDELVAAGRARFTMALVETNRGCPFTCTFCDWSLTRHVVEFPLDRVEAELDWIAAHGFGHVCICDANFGIRPRDHDIARYLAGKKAETGDPTYCYFYLTKNNAGRNLGTIEILHEAGIGCCVGLAVQDFDEDVLEAVRRDNIQSGESMQLRDVCAERGIPTHNELIFGLPRQTFASFARTVVEAMAPYPRHTFVVFQSRLLGDTELASPESRERFGIESRRCRWVPADTSRDAVVDEVQELVVATKDMPIPAWRRTYRFVYLASAAYNLRLLRVVLQYLGTVGADRGAYLAGLCDASAGAEPGTVLAEIGSVFDRYVDSILAAGPFTLPSALVGDAPLAVEDSVAATALARPAAFFAEARAHAERFLDDAGLDATLLAELFCYQELVTPRFGEPEAVALELERDWPAFAVSGRHDPPAARRQRVEFVPPSYAAVPDFGLFVTTHIACLRAGLSAGEVVSGRADEAQEMDGVVHARPLVRVDPPRHPLPLVGDREPGVEPGGGLRREDPAQLLDARSP
jgi:radical SAM superfamily enzyme YgiQ (UPF0313 family)